MRVRPIARTSGARRAAAGRPGGRAATPPLPLPGLHGTGRRGGGLVGGRARGTLPARPPSHSPPGPCVSCAGRRGLAPKFPHRQPVSLDAPDCGKTATGWAVLRPHQGASGSRRQAFASGTGDKRFLMRSRAQPMPSQCTASTPRLPSSSRASRTAGPAGSRPGPAAGFHGAHSKGDVAAVPPYDRRNVAYAAPCRARGAVGCGRGRKQRLARNAAPEERVCEPDAEGAEPKRAPEPVRAACKPRGRDPASSRASARRPERVGPLPPRPPARGGRPACSPSCRTRASLGASNPMWPFGFVTGGVSGNWQAGAAGQVAVPSSDGPPPRPRARCRVRSAGPFGAGHLSSGIGRAGTAGQLKSS